MSGAIIRRFKIVKLYGYKDVEISFRDNVLILIAGNGSGKTTILNALHAFLRRRFHRLQSLDFESIECEFCQTGKTIVLTKSQISGEKSDIHSRLARFSQEAGVTEDEFFEFLQFTYRRDRGSVSLREHPIIRALFAETPMGYHDIYEALDLLLADLATYNSEELAPISDAISSALADVEILYLPTYRRIEDPLLSPKGRVRRAPSLPPHRRRDVGRLPVNSSHINFGLEDVEMRLAQLSDEVERISNLEYRSASATIIDDALTKAIKYQGASTDGLPDLESLKRFLSRVSRDARMGYENRLASTAPDSQNEKRIAAIARLYSTEEIASEENRWLRYFLSRLGAVIEKTKETEAMLQRFVDACNSYLSESSEEKLFTYDPNLMRVAVINSWTDKEVPLSQLSSGEKQIVSILAKLYLYERVKLVLIDEPELSLSIDWQRRILPDMVNSGSVCQLLAITHSPFVFDNSLDPYAGSLNIAKSREEAR